MGDSKADPKPTLEGLVRALPGRIFKRDALAIMVTLGLGAGGAVWAQNKAEEKVEKVTETKVAPVKKQVESLAGDVADLRRELAAKERRDAERFDLLYRTILTGRSSSRAEALAVPATATLDGGQ